MIWVIKKSLKLIVFLKFIIKKYKSINIQARLNMLWVYKGFKYKFLYFCIYYIQLNNLKHTYIQIFLYL